MIRNRVTLLRRIDISLLVALGLATAPACNCGHHATSGGSTTGAATAGATSGASNGGQSGGGSTGGSGSAGTTSGGNGDGGCGLWSCAKANANCGPVGDGCGGILQCGSCSGAETCGGGGTHGVCGGHAGCVPQSCADAGATCGPLADGCGHLLQCGNCSGTDSCGGSGIPNVCGLAVEVDGGDLYPDGGCRPLTCAGQQIFCGPAGDGCGGTLDCGGCDAGTCGGSGAPNVCGSP